jgi:DNA-binding NtrC family response regulator
MRLNRKRMELADDARNLLAAYHWPGNVRELENLITRACVLNQSGAIEAGEIRPWLQQPELIGDGAGAQPASVGSVGSLDDMERQMIVATLERFDGNRGKAAAALGIGVRTLSGKLRSYGFAPRTREFSGTAIGASRQILPVGSAGSAVGEVRRTA